MEIWWLCDNTLLLNEQTVRRRNYSLKKVFLKEKKLKKLKILVETRMEAGGRRCPEAFILFFIFYFLLFNLPVLSLSVGAAGIVLYSSRSQFNFLSTTSQLLTFPLHHLYHLHFIHFGFHGDAFLLHHFSPSCLPTQTNPPSQSPPLHPRL